MDNISGDENEKFSCRFCIKQFKSAENFAGHLRSNHCTQEGGSFVCRYGENGVCSSLPLEGVNSVDYESHVLSQHMLERSIQRHKKFSTMSLLDTTDRGKWNLYSASQNLCAVLNNPNESKQKDLFTKLWGDSFRETHHVQHPAYLPVVTKNHFESYLKKTTKRYRRHSKITRNYNTDLKNTLVHHFPTLRRLKSPERSELDVSEIPEIFIKSKFNLSCPKTFNVVFPHLLEHISSHRHMGQTAKREPGTSSKDTQEKLHQYLDVVEGQIAGQVSSRADAFFHAMTSHDTLMEQLSQTICKVRTLREKIQNVDNDLVIDLLRALKCVRSRNNRVLVLHKLRIMRMVHQVQPVIELSISTADYVRALDLIYSSMDFLNNELAGIRCFRYLSSKLKEMIKTIDGLMLVEFKRCVSFDLNRPLNEDDDDDDVSVLEPEKLLCVVLSMMRRDYLSFVEIYREECEDAIKALVKQISVNAVTSSKSPMFQQHITDSSLNDQLRLLATDEWTSLLTNISTSLVRILSRIKASYDIMLNATNQAAGKINSVGSSIEETVECRKSFLMSNSGTESFLDEENYNLVTDKLSVMLSVICKYTLEKYSNQLSKLMNLQDTDCIRNGPNTQHVEKCLSNNWLKQDAQNQIREVAKCVEKLCSACQDMGCDQSASKTLRNKFDLLVKKFMNSFHRDRMEKMMILLKNETWKQTDVPYTFQQLVHRIDNCGKISPCGVESKLNKSNTHLVAGSEEYVVVGTVLLLINTVAEYCMYAEDIPSSALYLFHHVTDLLRNFNSECCKLSIRKEVSLEENEVIRNCSSLALLLRTLQLLLWLSSKIRIHFEDIVGITLNTSQLESVSSEVKEHVEDIKKQLLLIATQTIIFQLSNWEAKPPVPSTAFKNLSRHACKLYTAISGILKEGDVIEIFKNANKCFKNALKESIIRMDIVMDGGPKNGLVTQELIFYLEDLKKVPALPKEELKLECMGDIWKRKENGE